MQYQLEDITLTYVGALQEILKNYCSSSALGPVPAALIQKARPRRKERHSFEGNKLLSLLPTDIQVSEYGSQDQCPLSTPP